MNGNFDIRAKNYSIEYSTNVDHKFIKQILNQFQGSVLEIPSGSGRNLNLWETYTYKVTCIDLENDMIKELNKTIVDRKIKNVIACQGDMMNLDNQGCFNIIFIPQGGIQLLSSIYDVSRTIHECYKHLLVGGVLIIDTATFSRTWELDKDIIPSYFNPSLENEIQVKDWKRKTQYGYLERWHKQADSEDSLITQFKYIENYLHKSYKEYLASMQSIKIDEQTMNQIAFQNGFVHISTYRNYNCDLYRYDGNRRIYIFRKQ